jgi:2',3'-cyclic-nucleotide 2'-phosphodiesterase (5'-nucleotidase family)
MMRITMPSLFLLSALLSACGGGGADTAPVATIPRAPLAAPVSVTFIHLNDLHAHLVEHAEQVRQPTTTGTILVSVRGGLARTATKINQIRANNTYSILMNIGDTYHGGAEAMFSNGNAIIDPVNALGIDIGVPGNWDYAYGPVVTNARYGNLTSVDVKRPNFAMLGANVTYKIPDTLANQPLAAKAVQSAFKYTAGQPFLPATIVIEKGGVKIGLIGITSDIVPQMHPLMAFNLEFLQGQSAYLSLVQNQAAALRQQGVDFVAVMSELGIHKDWALANALPANTVQVFFSAHTHEATFTKKIAPNGTVVVEAGDDAYLGEMKANFDVNRTLTSMDWTLHTITQDIAEDTNMKALVDAARAPFLVPAPNITIPTVSLPSGISLPASSTQTLIHPLTEVLATTTIPLQRASNALESDFNNAYSDLLRRQTSTQVSMTPGFRFDSAIIPSAQSATGTTHYYWQTEGVGTLSGQVTVEDAYRFFPSPYQLAQGSVTGARLKEVIEGNLNTVFSTNAFEQGGGWVDGYSGLNLTVDLTKPAGQRVSAMQLSDTQSVVLASDTLLVSGCSRPMDTNATTTLCSYDGFSNVTNLINPDNGQSYAASDFFIKALQQGWLAQLAQRKNITDTSATKLWPDSEFYQPLEGAK